MSDMTPAYLAVVKDIKEAIEEQFAQEGARGPGGKWQDLSEPYATWKGAQEFDPGTILRATNLLYDSLTEESHPEQVMIISGGGLGFGSTSSHGAYHQQGAGNNPVRKIFDFTELDKRGWIKQLQHYIVTGELGAAALRMSLQVYGRLLDTHQIEVAVTETLQVWMPAYIAEVERQRGLEPHAMPLPASWSKTNEFYKWNEDQLPAMIVVCPGLAPTEPKMKGDGSYHAWYRVGVAAIAGGDDREATRRVAKLYVAAIRGSILQHQDLGDFGAEGIRWTNERNAEIPDDAGRTLGSGLATFDVEVKDVANARMGPLDPPDDPYEDAVLAAGADHRRRR